MSYLQLNPNGTASDLGVITGYRVAYRQGRRKVQSKPFPFLWQALGFQKSLRMGQNSNIVPIYSKTK